MPHATAADGLSIYYETAGAGRPLLLIGGAFGTLVDWQDTGVFDDLARDRRVIAMDLRGHGRSDGPHDAAMYGWRKNATDALAVLEAEGGLGVDVVGQSMGANICVAMLHGDVSRIRSFAGNGAIVPPAPLTSPAAMLLKRAAMLRERGMAWAIDELQAGALPGEEMSSAKRERVLAGDPLAYAAEAEGQGRHAGRVVPAVRSPDADDHR